MVGSVERWHSGCKGRDMLYYKASTIADTGVRATLQQGHSYSKRYSGRVSG